MVYALIIKYLESINYKPSPNDVSCFRVVSHKNVFVFIENNSENSFHNELLKVRAEVCGRLELCKCIMTNSRTPLFICYFENIIPSVRPIPFSAWPRKSKVIIYGP